MAQRYHWLRPSQWGWPSTSISQKTHNDPPSKSTRHRGGALSARVLKRKPAPAATGPAGVVKLNVAGCTSDFHHKIVPRARDREARENAVLGRFRLALLLALVFSPLTTSAQAEPYCSPYRVTLSNCGRPYATYVTGYVVPPDFWLVGCRGMMCIRHGRCISELRSDTCDGTQTGTLNPRGCLQWICTTGRSTGLYQSPYGKGNR